MCRLCRSPARFAAGKAPKSHVLRGLVRASSHVDSIVFNVDTNASGEISDKLRLTYAVKQ